MNNKLEVKIYTSAFGSNSKLINGYEELWTFLTQNIVAKLHEMEFVHGFSGHIANHFTKKHWTMWGSILTVNLVVVSPTLNLNQTLFVIPFKKLGFIDLQCCNCYHLPCDFIQNAIIHDNILSQVASKRRYGFGQRMNPSIILDIICKLILMKCHLKSCHSDVK